MKNVYYWLTGLFQVFEFNALIKQEGPEGPGSLT